MVFALAHIEKYVAVRRDLLALWEAKQRLSQSAPSRFPKSHPLFKTISQLCHSDATQKIRYLCDVAICKCADRCGDDLFRDRVVDGECIPAVTHFYYGISHLVPEKKMDQGRIDKQLTSSDLQLFDETYRLGRKFIESVSVLPFLSAKEFAREQQRFEKEFERARARVEDSSLLYAAYLRLQEKVPPAIAGDIVSLSSGSRE